MTSRLETLPQEIRERIFSHVTDVFPRAHPSRHSRRPPAFPRRLDPKRQHPYTAIARVSRTLNVSIEMYAQHLLAAAGSPFRRASRLDTARHRLLVAATKQRCVFCLVELPDCQRQIAMPYFKECGDCAERFLGGSISGRGLAERYLPLEPARVLDILPCIPIVSHGSDARSHAFVRAIRYLKKASFAIRKSQAGRDLSQL